MKIRYRLTPQMKEYDRLMTTYLPYLMFFQAPLYSSKTVNTDSRGFRISYKGPAKIADFRNIDDRPVSIIIGNSLVFGVGATRDGNTISSLLNAHGDDLWLNFGGRAFSSTQELFLFLTYRTHVRNIKKIIVMSGLNNLTIYYLARNYSKELGACYYWNEFSRAMSYRMLSKRKKMIRVFSELFNGFEARREKGRNSLMPDPIFKAVGDHNKEKEDLLHVFQRDISTWKLISKALGIELYYVLQPMANWTRKKLSQEEEMLFAELDSQPGNLWKMVKKNITRDLHSWLQGRLKNICDSHEVHFFDMNKAVSDRRLDGKWLYVDRAHLTDEGYRVVADVLEKEMLSI